MKKICLYVVLLLEIALIVFIGFSAYRAYVAVDDAYTSIEKAGTAEIHRDVSTTTSPSAPTSTIPPSENNGTPEEDGGVGDGSAPGINPSTPVPSGPLAHPVVSGGCVVGGCSSQLCVDPKKESTMSTCEYSEHYTCYQSARCERQANNTCGWTQTPELKQCLLMRSTIQ